MWSLLVLFAALPLFITLNAFLGLWTWVVYLSVSLVILALAGLRAYFERRLTLVSHLFTAFFCVTTLGLFHTAAFNCSYLMLVLVPLVAVSILGALPGAFWTWANLVLFAADWWFIPGPGNGFRAAPPWNLDSLIFWSVIVLSVFTAFWVMVILLRVIKTMVRRHRSIQDQLIRRQQVLIGLMEEEKLFYQILSHDLRSPVLKVTQFLGMYLNERDTFDEETWPKILGDVYRSSEALSILLENLFNWIKNRQGKGAVNREEYSFQQILLDLKGIYGPMARSKDIELEISIEDATFWTDGYIITTILRNLLSNALKFTPRKGRILLEAGLTSAGAPFFQVTDTGRGFDLSQWDNLRTTALTQDVPHSRGTENEVGSGFGLRMCLILARNLGADLRVKPLDAPARGTAFILTLPGPVL